MKSTKLYNVILPIWLLWIFPPIIFVVIIANTIIDLAVAFLSMKSLKITEAFKKAKKCLLKIVLIGFFSDFIGALFLFLTISLSNSPFVESAAWNPFANITSILVTLVAIVIAAILIYFLNYILSFNKVDIADKDKKKIALYLAIFTAPYTFLIPTMWFY